MIIVHSAPARHVAHHLAALSAGQAIENEQLFEVYTTTGADAAWAGPRQGRPAPAALPGPGRPACPGRLPAPTALPASPLCCPGRLASPPPACPTALPHPQEERAPSAFSSRALMLAPPGRGRRPGAPAVPKPGRLPTAPAGRRLPPSASAAGCGWSRPRTAGDSGGAPPRAFRGPGPALSLGFTLPAAAPGGSTHLSPPE